MKILGLGEDKMNNFKVNETKPEERCVRFAYLGFVPSEHPFDSPNNRGCQTVEEGNNQYTYPKCAGVCAASVLKPHDCTRLSTFNEGKTWYCCAGKKDCTNGKPCKSARPLRQSRVDTEDCVRAIKAGLPYQILTTSSALAAASEVGREMREDVGN